MGTYKDNNYRFIENRASFYKVLDQAITKSEELQEDDAIKVVLLQLRAIKQWTENNQKPSDEDLASLCINRIVAQNFEPLRGRSKELDNWCQMVGEIEIYVGQWLSDEDFTTLNDEDVPWY